MGWFEKYTLLCVVLVIASLSLILIGSVQLLHRADDRINRDSVALLDELYTKRLQEDATPSVGETGGSRPLLAIIIRSRKANYLLRKTIRHTWARDDYRLVHRFALVSNDAPPSVAPDNGRRPFDAWLRRLNRRGTMRTARYFLFVDDTVFVNIRVLMEALERTLPTGQLVLCVPRGGDSQLNQTTDTCDASRPVLLSGDVLRDRPPAPVPPTMYDATRLHLSRHDTEAILHHQMDADIAARLVYFFSAPLDQLSSGTWTPMPLAVERLWESLNGNFFSVAA